MVSRQDRRVSVPKAFVAPRYFSTFSTDWLALLIIGSTNAGHDFFRVSDNQAIGTHIFNLIRPKDYFGITIDFRS